MERRENDRDRAILEIPFRIRSDGSMTWVEPEWERVRVQGRGKVLRPPWIEMPDIAYVRIEMDGVVGEFGIEFDDEKGANGAVR